MDNDVRERVMTQPEKIDHIFNGCVNYFGINKEDLYDKKKKSDMLWDKKRYIAYILYNNTFMTLRQIGSLVGYKSHDLVLYHVNAMKDLLSDASYGSDKTKRLYKELLTYLNL